MRFFDLRDFQFWILAVFLGLISAVAVYLAFLSYRFSMGRKGGRPAEEEEEYPGGIKSAGNPVPPFLIFIIAGVLIWAIFYVFFLGIKGGPF
jgi:amino acid transporter